MIDKPHRTIVHVSNPTAFAGQGSVIILELADHDAALAVAKKIAEETGRRVTLRDAGMDVLGSLSPQERTTGQSVRRVCRDITLTSKTANHIGTTSVKISPTIRPLGGVRSGSPGRSRIGSRPVAHGELRCAIVTKHLFSELRLGASGFVEASSWLTKSWR